MTLMEVQCKPWVRCKLWAHPWQRMQEVLQEVLTSCGPGEPDFSFEWCLGWVWWYSWMAYRIPVDHPGKFFVWGLRAFGAVFLTTSTNPLVSKTLYIHSYWFHIRGWWIPFPKRRTTTIFMIIEMPKCRNWTSQPLTVDFVSSFLNSFFGCCAYILWNEKWEISNTSWNS